MDGYRYEEENAICLFSSDEDTGAQMQAQSLVEVSGAVMVSTLKPVPEVDYFQELLAIQQQRPRAIVFFWDKEYGIHATRAYRDS